MLPALLYGSSSVNLKDFGLGKNEILPLEPCHDIAGHIKNVLMELPFHVLEGHKTILEKAIQISLGNSDTKRSVDYRKALLTISGFCRSKIHPFAQELLETLVEIQMLAYMGENKRTPKSIFRFLNQSYLHFNLCHTVLGKNLKNISRRKLYGSYFHALIPHGGLN